MMPVPDQQEGKEAGQFPEEGDLDQIARHDDAEHRPHEGLKEGEEARDRVLSRHVIARIEDEERPDAEDERGEEPGEAVEPKREVEPERRQPRAEEHTSELQALM